MARAKASLFGTLLGAAVMFLALQYHVVRSPEGFQLIPRTPQHSLGLAYADIRAWDAAKWADRTELARALMAHGSGDLISQSVTESLSDSVSSDGATLDELRSFFNRPPAGETSPDSSLFRLPDLQPLQPGNPAGSNPGARDQISIPVPREARKPDVTDPFRLAQTPDAPSATANATGRNSSNAVTNGTSGTSGAGSQPSRFTASDILEESASVFEDVTPPAPRTNAPAGTFGNGDSRPTPATPSETRRYSDSVEQAIFGPSASATPFRSPTTGTAAAARGSSGAGLAESPSPGVSPRVAVANGDSATGSVGSRPAPVTPDPGPFGDVTADLESRARSALSRAESTLNNPSGSSRATTSSSVDEFVRGPLRDAVGQGRALPPAGPGTASGNSLSGATGSRTIPLPVVDALIPSPEKFDPFIE